MQPSDYFKEVYKRNLLGQVETVINNLDQIESYEYDIDGNMISKTDRDGFKTEWFYGISGKVEKIKYDDGTYTQFTYDKLKALESIKDSLGNTLIQRDAIGRVKSVVDFAGRKVAYEYGKSGKKSKIVYPNGRSVKYYYNNYAQLERLEEGNDIIHYAYDKSGNLIRKEIGNCLKNTYKYDKMGNLEQFIQYSQDMVKNRYQYEYDSMCNKTKVEITCDKSDYNGIYGYSYDGLSRLIDVKYGKESIKSYEYDSFNNRSLMKEGNHITRYSYNSLNQLIRKDFGDVITSYEYDLRGNMTAVFENNNMVKKFEFGVTNQLISAKDGEREQTYSYNGLNLLSGRYEQNHNPSTSNHVEYLLDLTRPYNNLLGEYENNCEKMFVWDEDIIKEVANDKHSYYRVDKYSDGKSNV